MISFYNKLKTSLSSVPQLTNVNGWFVVTETSNDVERRKYIDEESNRVRETLGNEKIERTTREVDS